MSLHFAVCQFGEKRVKPGENRGFCRRAGRWTRTCGLLLLAAGLAGCAGGGGGGASAELAAIDPAASPVSLYETGVAQVEAHELDAARRSFVAALLRARQSGIDFAPPHEGLARVLLEQGKLDDATYEANAAVELDRRWTPGYLVLGRIAEREKNPELALAHYQHGLAIAPDDAPLTTAALALLRGEGRHREADELARQARAVAGAQGQAPPAGAAESGPGPAGAPPPDDAPPTAAAPSRAPGAVASDDSSTAATRRLLAPFFPEDVDRLGARLLAVFQQPQFTRGALAVLVVGDGRHGLCPAFDRTIGARAGNDTPPRDIGGRPEESWIGRGLRVGALEPLPDGTFQPDQVLRRLALALWLEETIERLRNDRRVFSTYRGQPSPFADLPDAHYGLNAARLAVQMGLLAPRADGRFAPDEAVTMGEGVAALRRLPAVLMQEPPRRP